MVSFFNVDWRRITTDPSAIGLIAANLIMIALAIVFQWGAFEALLMYWCQSIIVGFFTIFRMMLAPLFSSDKPGLVGWLISIPFRLFLTGFFIVHFGGFCLGHLLFIVVLTGDLTGNPDTFAVLPPLFFDPVILTGIALFFVVHLISFLLHRSELEKSNAGSEMFRPYGRVIVMHLSVILGAFVMLFLGNQVWLLVVFMLIKTVADVGTHLAEHQNASKAVIS